MITTASLLIVVTGVLSFGANPDKIKVLTEADIPANISSELKELIQHTFSTNIHKRAEAAKMLGMMRESAAPAVPYLIRLGDDFTFIDGCSDYYARNALVEIGKPALEECIAEAKVDSEKHMFAALYCLGKFKNEPQAIDALLELLKSPDSLVRRQTAIALIGVVDTRAVLPLIDALNDDEEVRSFATECFYTLRDSRSVEPLIRLATSDWAITVKNKALIALGYQQDRRAVTELKDILQDTRVNVTTRALAASSLGRIRDCSLFPILADILKDRRAATELRLGAALGIAAYRDSKMEYTPEESFNARIYELLTSVLMNNEESVEMRSCVTQVLGEFDNPEAVKLLSQLADEHERDKLGFFAAMAAVKLMNGAVGNKSFVNAISSYKEFHDGDDIYVRDKRNALQKIAENGTTWRVRFAAINGNTLLIDIPLGIIICALLALLGLIFHRFYRKRKVDPVVKTLGVSKR